MTFREILARFPSVNGRTVALIVGGGVLLVFSPLWWSSLGSLASRLAPEANAGTEETADSHEEHGDHAHDPAITISETARANIGLKTGPIQLQNYARSLTFPALVVERPGRSRHSISAPMTGIVTSINILPGQMVESSDVLFQLRLTHEDLVNAQREYLATHGQLDVERKELNRLKQVSSSVMARKILLEKEYEIEKLEASIKAQKKALALHGLTGEQISGIETKRTLVRELTVSVPFFHADDSLHGREDEDHIFEENQSETHIIEKEQFLVQHLMVHPGEAVVTGQPLCHLMDFETLLIEGRAFEQDADEIRNAADSQATIQALAEGQNAMASELADLKIHRIANEIDVDSRSLHFFVELPNVVGQEQVRDGRRFPSWKFKPGQRMQLRVPVETWNGVIVLPLDAITEEGLHTYVFVENGKQFERREVWVLARDQLNAVIANDGSLFLEETVALNNAHQLLMALKKQSGGEGGGHHHGHMH